jgi:hypothetical protein
MTSEIEGVKNREKIGNAVTRVDCAANGRRRDGLILDTRSTTDGLFFLRGSTLSVCVPADEYPRRGIVSAGVTYGKPATAEY